MKDTGKRHPATDNGQSIDDLLQDLGRMLHVAPSPEFGTKVLARVQHSTRESLLWSWRWGFAAGALVTVVVLAVVTQVNSKAPVTRLQESSAKLPAASPVVEPARSAPVAVSAASGVPRQRGLRLRSARATRPASENPHVLTAPDQAAAVRTLLERFARGHVPSTVPNKDTAEPALQDLAIDELAPIPLIVISPLDAPPNAGGAGSRK